MGHSLFLVHPTSFIQVLHCFPLTAIEGENVLDDILDDCHEGDDFSAEMIEETGMSLKVH